MPFRKLVTKSCPRLHAHHLVSCYDRLCRAAIASTASRPLPDLTSPHRPAVRQHFTLRRRRALPPHIPPALLYDRCSYLFLFLFTSYLSGLHTLFYFYPWKFHWTVLEGIALATIVKRRLFNCYHTAESRPFRYPYPPSVVVRTALVLAAARTTLAVLVPGSIFTFRPRSFHARQLLFITLCTLWKTRNSSFSVSSPCSRVNTSQTLISYSCTPTHRSQSGWGGLFSLNRLFLRAPLPGLPFILRSPSTCVRPGVTPAPSNCIYRPFHYFTPTCTYIFFWITFCSAPLHPTVLLPIQLLPITHCMSSIPSHPTPPRTSLVTYYPRRTMLF